ncbi:MAG: hypothetical protein IPM47_07620 [Sphingobacteriales bacterium]|nr:MAG: hypothetical protein IPM47_07620 [Sphingobacteriales bacterium]
MKKLSICLLLLSLISIAFVACNRSAGGAMVEIQSKNFENEILRNENLSFTFNTTLVPDSLLMKWDSTAYIQFNPAIPGRFRWTSGNTLVFSPFEEFAPNSQFTGKLTKDLLKLCR